MNKIDIKSSTINKSLDLVKSFLQKLVSPSIEELGLLFADNVKTWRLKNQIKTLNKVQKIVNEENIDVQHVNLKILLPYLEGISLEENDTIQNMWANLLVNYADSNKNLNVNVYPNILRQLSTGEILILEYMVSNNGRIFDNPNNQDFEFKYDELANLVRLGIIYQKKEYVVGQYGFNEVIQVRSSIIGDEYEFSMFGLEFINACKR